MRFLRFFMSLLSVSLVGCSTWQGERSAVPPVAFTTDGCSLFPNRSATADWCPCCVVHDLAYWRGGTAQERLQADQELRACVLGETNNRLLAALMFWGVRVGGGPYFKTSFRWGYGWPYGRGYLPLNDEEQSAIAALEAQYRASHPQLRCEP